jgi:hypothetical protein
MIFLFFDNQPISRHETKYLISPHVSCSCVPGYQKSVFKNPTSTHHQQPEASSPSHQPPATSRQPPATSHQPPAASHQGLA